MLGTHLCSDYKEKHNIKLILGGGGGGGGGGSMGNQPLNLVVIAS